MFVSYLILKESFYLLCGKWAVGKQNRKTGDQVKGNYSNLPRKDDGLD